MDGMWFVVAAAVSLGMSWVLVSRLERIGEAAGLTEGLLGLVAALAADVPEITSSITALAHHQHAVGAGVVIGSNVFNLAALIGLGAVVAGLINLHRRVVVLGGVFALPIAAVCLLAVLGVLGAAVAFVISATTLAVYGVVLAEGRARLGRVPVPRRLDRWIGRAVEEEEEELLEAIHPRRGTLADGAVAFASLAVVLGASIVIERTASSFGAAHGWSEIVIGGLILAAATSLPNAVAGVYLASRGRGAAALSTVLNSNSINVTLGLLLPAMFLGLGSASADSTLTTSWYVGLTVLVLIAAFVRRGIGRAVGFVIVGAYVAFVAVVLATMGSPA
jgi:cation:H+ antiporter